MYVNYYRLNLKTTFLFAIDLNLRFVSFDIVVHWKLKNNRRKHKLLGLIQSLAIGLQWWFSSFYIVSLSSNNQ